MKKEKRFCIWSYDINPEEWIDDLREEHPDKTDDELTRLAYDINDEYLDDERANLNIDLRTNILVIGNLGLWDGRHTGYKDIGRNISDCLYCYDDLAEWYVDERGDLRGIGHHHDGTNYYLYRAYKDTATEQQIENLKDKLYNGTATRRDITRITRRLGDDIAAVYGWDIGGQTKSKRTPQQ